MTDKAAWIDGSFEGRLSPYDLGFLLGQGVFETIGVFDGRLPLWGPHIGRMRQGASWLGIPWDPAPDLRAVAEELLDRNAGDDILRITLTAGDGKVPTWCMTTRARLPQPDASILVPSSFLRHPTDPLAVVKSTSYAFQTMANREARAAGADDAILMGPGERILETTTCNLFFQKDDMLHTPRVDGSFLPGVGREALLWGLEERGFEVAHSDYRLADLAAADAIFTTNAVYGPRAAVLLDKKSTPLPEDVLLAWQRVLDTRA